MKKQWIKFTTWTGIEAGYVINGSEVDYKIFSKIPKRWYYSACNEVGDYLDEVIFPKINYKPS